MPMPAVYLRVSSLPQRDKGSIQSQEHAITLWLATQGMTADDVLWYRDDGISGKEPIAGRGDGARLVADVKSGAVSQFVAVFSISRISRETSDFFAFRTTLREHSVALIGIAEGVDTRSVSGDFVAGIHAMLADEAHKGMIEAIRSGKNRAAIKGKWQGRAPYGYIVTDGILTPDPALVPIVRKIYALYLSGAGAGVIQNWLHENHVPTPRGGREWHVNAIRVILTNPVYKGEAAWNRVTTRRGRRVKQNPRQEHVTITVPAIIDAQTWERAQQLRAHAGKRFQRTGKSAAYTLLSRLRCALCGAPYNRAKQDNPYNEVHYYRHNRYKQSYKECPSRNIPAAILDAAIWRECAAAIRDPDKWRDALIADLQAEAEGEQRRRDLQEVDAGVKRVLAQLDRLEEAYLNGVMPLDRYTPRARLLAEQRTMLESHRAALLRHDEQNAHRAANAASLVDTMRQYIGVADTTYPDIQRGIIDRLIAEVRASYVDGAIRTHIYWSV